MHNQTEASCKQQGCRNCQKRSEDSKVAEEKGELDV